MAYSPHIKSTGAKDLSGTKKSLGGLFVFVKKISRFLNKTKKTVNTLQTKRDIERLERDRSREHTELLRQRRSYENLLRHSNTKSDIPVVNDNKKILKPVPKKELDKFISQPELKQEVYKAETVLEIPRPAEVEKEVVIPEPIVDKIPNSQDIYPVEKKLLEDPIFNSKETAESVEEIEAPAPSVAPKIESRKVELAVPSPIVQVKAKNSINFFEKLSTLFSKTSLAKKLSNEREAESAVMSKNEVESRFWQSYNGVKANLIKDQVVLFFNWQQKMLTLSLSLILCCLAISLVYVSLLIWQKEKLNDNKSTFANQAAINNEVVKSESELKEITAFNKKLDAVSYILNNHVYWTNFFVFLENNTLKDVYFTSFSGDLSGKYKIPSIARNLDAISLQLEVMKGYNMLRTVQYSASQTVPATADKPSTVKFDLEMSLDQKIFIK
ncbi:MAG: hypothetical protein NTY12_00485 [Candidatus Falkowbacteria bacterium]|nr:hypothetical protein [Candidatus Falkowbacteria bacterium]